MERMSVNDKDCVELILWKYLKKIPVSDGASASDVSIYMGSKV